MWLKSLRLVLILMGVAAILTVATTVSVASDEQCRQACQEEYQSELAECQADLAAALPACDDEDAEAGDDQDAEAGDDAAGGDDGVSDEGDSRDDATSLCRLEAQRQFALCRRDALRNRAACFAACAQSPSSP